MPLPLCVKIDVGDYRSHGALLGDGWREIGVLDTYQGSVAPRRWDDVDYGKLTDALTFPVASYGFSGRLWRDPQIAEKDAVAATKEYLKSVIGFMVEDEAFLVVTPKAHGITINLIGSLVRRSGNAEWLIRNAVAEFNAPTVKAGTYADNIAARSLYHKLGMSLAKSERVLHK